MFCLSLFSVVLFPEAAEKFLLNFSLFLEFNLTFLFGSMIKELLFCYLKRISVVVFFINTALPAFSS